MGNLDKLASVRLRTFPPTRYDSRSRTAGGRVAIGDDVDMHAHYSSLCVNIYQTIKGFRHAYILQPKISLSAFPKDA